MTDAHARLEVRGLTKRFGALAANDGIALSIRPGELHCLLGENGAGKSTLSSCLFGLVQPDAGEIAIDGRPLALRSPADAIAAGIGMVHQHFVLVPAFTVLENIMVGTGHGWRADRRAGRDRIAAICARYGLTLDPDRRVEDLSVGEKQWVEIVKALYLGARLLILDEPTAVLTPQESGRLFGIIRQLTGSGISVILITHKMNEVMQSDRVTVLRRGRLVATVDTAGVSRDELSEMMVGRRIRSVAADRTGQAPPEALSISGLQLRLVRGHAPGPFGLTVGRGEILGIAGIAGNGQDELLETIAGLRPAAAGDMRLNGHALNGLRAAEIAALGVGYVPGDRFRDGLVGDFSIAENVILGAHWKAEWRRGALMDVRAIRRRGAEAISDFAIAATGPEMRCARLSGGNAQKVILSREFAKARRLLLCNQPTRGVDVGATEFIHAELLRKRDEGCAILLVSEEIDDLLALSDRIAVMFAGAAVGTFAREDADAGLIGQLMAGTAQEVPA